MFIKGQIIPLNCFIIFDVRMEIDKNTSGCVFRKSGINMTRGATWTFIFFGERSCDFCRNKSEMQETWDENQEKYDQNVGGYEMRGY